MKRRRWKEEGEDGKKKGKLKRRGRWKEEGRKEENVDSGRRRLK